MKNVLFYHKNCPDGFGAAYSFWKKFKNKMEYIPIGHFDEIEESVYRNKNVYMADICLDRNFMLKIKQLSKSFQVLDHHISAQEKLSDLDFCKFNQDMSGAMISWVYLFPDRPPPNIIRHIQDRDLFTFAIENTKEILASLDSEGFDFGKWDLFERRLSRSRQSIIKEGSSIVKSNNNLIKILVKRAYNLNIAGIEVPIVNVPFFQSDVLAMLASEVETFAAGYYFDGKNYVFSLRSSKSGMDVSKISNLFGGGGHRHAAGFSVTCMSELSEKKWKN